MDALAQGLHNADVALGALVDYLEDYDEPVILVFWGDHLPGMYVTPDHSIFSALGYVPTADIAQWSAETVKQMYSTNYFVWNNDGARLKAPKEVGAMQLGSLTLGWAGGREASLLPVGGHVQGEPAGVSWQPVCGRRWDAHPAGPSGGRGTVEYLPAVFCTTCSIPRRPRRGRRD